MLHEPLVSITWTRDMDLRTDVTTGDEWTSFTNSTFAAGGGLATQGISWAGTNVNAIQSVSLDIGKTAQPLRVWAQELFYTMPELASAMRVGRPIDEQKLKALQLKDQMDTDQLVYIGDPVIGTTGLVNHVTVTNVSNAPTGGWTALAAAGTPDGILADLNEVLTSAWAASGYAIVPSELRLPPLKFGLLVSTKVSTAGNVSVLRYFQENNITVTNGSKPLNIQPAKWLTGRGAAGADRMIAYTKEYDKIRFPQTPLQRTPLEWRSIYNLTTYWSKKGQVECTYPELLAYRDGI
jgi:hypothetical protein